MKTTAKLWVGIGILILLSPLGVIFPEHFKAGDAWGEWGTDTIKELVGYIPRGLEKFSSLWNAPIPDYAFKGWEGNGLRYLSAAYILSAAAGVIAVITAVFLIGKILTRRND